MAPLKRFPLLLLLLASCGKADPPAVPAPAAAETPLVLLPAGEFTMGAASGRPDETAHPVKLAAFWIERRAVTQELYEKVMGVNPSKRKEPQNPVERIQWVMAARFCNKASQLEGLTPCYNPETWDCDFEADGYRLPTEAEWEYACRAGSRTRYANGDDPAQLSQIAWCKPHSGGLPKPVGRRQPNAWGLYDMHGNVWEWCHDWYGEGYYKESPPENPRGPAAGMHRVLRGGAADSPAERCTSSYRFKESPVFTDACFGADFYGFRRVRSAAGVKKTRPADTAKVEAAPKPAAPAPQAPPPPPGKLDPSKLKGRLVFVSDRAGSLDLWTMKANGTDPRPLTRDAFPDADPRWSPDGRAILYTTLRGGFPEVWTMKRDASGAVKVCAGSQAAWAPDGKAILLIRDNQAWVRDLSSGQEKKVVPDAWERCGVPAWHPGGKSFAVASRHEETIGIYLLSSDGKEPRRLKTAEGACTPCFSKDGRKLLFQTVKGRVHQMGLDGKGEEPVTFGADIQHDGRYSPDGRHLLFSRAPAAEGPWQICVADLESDDLDSVVLTKEGSNSLADWHADED